MSTVEPEVIKFSREQAAEARRDLSGFLAAYEAWVGTPEGAPEERARRTALARSIRGAERALIYGGEGHPTWGYVGGPQWVGLPNIVFQADPDGIFDVVHRADAELERQDKLFERQERSASATASSATPPPLEVAAVGVKSPGARRMTATLDDMASVLAAVDRLAGPPHTTIVKNQGGDVGKNNAVRAVTLMTAGLATVDRVRLALPRAGEASAV